MSTRAMHLLPMVLCLLLGASLPATAEVYRWVDEDGKVHYGDRPSQGVDAEPAKLPKLQSFEGRETPDIGRDKVKDEQATTAEYQTFTISSPANGATIRDAVTELPVSVTIAPGLQSGHGLLFWFDGRQVNQTPSRQPVITISGVYRGEHRVSAAIVDDQGKVIRRSAEHVFYMMQPRVGN